MSEVWTVNAALARLEAAGDPDVVAGLGRVGVSVDRIYGVKIPVLRALAKEIGQDHDLALALWETGVHEARILATMIDHPKWVTEEQMDRWVEDFNAWDVCDQCLCNLFDLMGRLAQQKALEWSYREEEYVKRAGFVLMARLAVGKKGMEDDDFEPFWPRLIEEATDERNFVKKAVNWALRQMGKRNAHLNRRAIAVAETMQHIDSPSARWIASDALRELTSEAVQERLTERES